MDSMDNMGNAKNIDLHIHSTYSDGVLDPCAIVDRWKEEGYTKIAITDHDGIEGSLIAYQYAQGIDGIELIPGAEFDSSNELGKKLHILAYDFDYQSEILNKTVETLRSWREERNNNMLDILNKAGYKLSPEDVAWGTNGEFLGKPHIARALIRKGYAKDTADVFDRIFSDECNMDRFEKRTMHSRDIVEMIHSAGGKAVLAHPFEQLKAGESRDDFRPRLVTLLDCFREYGIDGIECKHPSAKPDDEAFLIEYADKHGLLKTSGSDFHSDDAKRTYL